MIAISILLTLLTGVFVLFYILRPSARGNSAVVNNNSFNFLRFVAASSVLYSHHFPLAGLAEPVVPGYGVALGSVGVHIFFAMSGFLIFQSLERNHRLSSFLVARFLRIVPNLVFSLVVTSFVMLFWFRNFENLYGHLEFILLNITSFAHVPIYGIAGVLAGRPSEAINGSLWTLQYEVFFYFLLFFIYLWVRKTKIILFIMLGVLMIPNIDNLISNINFLSFQLNVHYLSILGISFFSGTLIAAYWTTISQWKSTISVVSVALLFLLYPTILAGTPIYYSISALLIVCLGSMNFACSFERYGDGSYGIYIFAFPVQQLCLISIPSFWLSMAFAFIITTFLGYFTWHTFEERCLSYRKYFAISIDSILRKFFEIIKK